MEQTKGVSFSIKILEWLSEFMYLTVISALAVQTAPSSKSKDLCHVYPAGHEFLKKSTMPWGYSVKTLFP